MKQLVILMVAAVVYLLDLVTAYHFHVDKIDHILFDDQKINENSLHKFLEQHERDLLFGKEISDYKYKLVNVRHNDSKRSKRSIEKTIHFNVDGNLKFTLKPSKNLVDRSFAFIMRDGGPPKIMEGEVAKIYESCFYQGDNSAFDLCDGNIRGIIRDNNTNLIIHPLPERFGNESHIVLHKIGTDFLRQNQTFEPDMSQYEPEQYNKKLSLSYQPRYRPKRMLANIPDILHIETAIFVDRDLFRHMAKNFPRNTETHLIRFVLAMINGVQLLYHHSSLGKKVNFILKRLEILHTDPTDLRRASDIDIYLNSFCSWQRKLNPISDADVVHFDHAVILTGLDLYVVGKNGKISSQVVGLAPVSGMCSATSSCTINEGKHFESVFVVAHEIGHNLGMRHDTSDSNCDPSLYIMSPTLGSGKITWSTCSKNYLNIFLRSSQATCLFDRGQFGPSLDHSAEGILPGERFDADKQCMLKYGKDSVRSLTQDFHDICRDLHCQRDRYTWTSHPALEGTECGVNMWCSSGVCVARHFIQQVSTVIPPEKLIQLDDARIEAEVFLPPSKPPVWSDWGEASECESGCLYGESGRLKEGSSGLRIFQRSCSEYESRKCQGPDKKFETCMAHQCYNIKRTTVLEFANEICARAMEFDSTLTGLGIQQVANPDESCQVFCETRNLLPKSKSWIFPDGTTCRNKGSDFDDEFFCVNGRCEKFSCENVTENYFRIEPDFCPQNLVFEEKNLPNSIQQENGRDYKSLKLDAKDKRFMDDIQNSTDSNQLDLQQNYVAASSVKSEIYDPNWMHRMPSSTTFKPRNGMSWFIKSGCHFSCMELAKGLQLVVAPDKTTNIQLCSPDLLPCDRIQTTFEYASKLCTKYRSKVRGLSGTGTQIQASVNDPDRSCKVACQDGYIDHRFYLVNGEQGFFPFGTRCSKTESRYCVSGKCLHFGDDGIPLNESYHTLALFRRNKRSLIKEHQKRVKRTKRHFLSFTPVNITERITRQFLDNLISNIDFTLKNDFDHLELEHIDMQNPIYYSFD